jgi:broad specificity phosphatase PhoE
VLVLVRHGEPTSYRDGGLTPLGREQAGGAARRVLALIRSGVLSGAVSIHTSPARRCRDTARLVVDHLGRHGVAVVGPVPAPGLAMVGAQLGSRLVDVGLARDRAAGHAAGADLASFWDDHSSGRNPFERWEEDAYPTFESPAEVQARVLDCLRGLGEPAVVVTHSEIIRLAARASRVDADDVGFGGVLPLATALGTIGAPGEPGRGMS